ncbi:MAG: hypothetical protein V2J19_08160 [Wenzhouxiangella sp.]|jgi:hypothetical protein|nr:hypothetical protein [Wenzhouxiangella sp.]
MARSFTPLFIVAILSSLSHVGAVQGSDEQAFRVPEESIGIDDLGLESQLPSALELVGADEGSAGANRAALAHRLQCWIDGRESCSPSDRNDPRVRAIRRFLATGPKDRDGAVFIHFPDETRIQVQLKRVVENAPRDWDQRVYETIVLPETARAP